MCYRTHCMFQNKVFVFEFIAINTFAASSVIFRKITTLKHELWNDSMHDGFFVAKPFLVGTERSEVCSTLWHDFVV